MSNINPEHIMIRHGLMDLDAASSFTARREKTSKVLWAPFKTTRAQKSARETASPIKDLIISHI